MIVTYRPNPVTDGKIKRQRQPTKAYIRTASLFGFIGALPDVTHYEPAESYWLHAHLARLFGLVIHAMKKWGLFNNMTQHDLDVINAYMEELRIRAFQYEKDTQMYIAFCLVELEYHIEKCVNRKKFPWKYKALDQLHSALVELNEYLVTTEGQQVYEYCEDGDHASQIWGEILKEGIKGVK
jgi:hypothetical protein